MKNIKKFFFIIILLISIFVLITLMKSILDGTKDFKDVGIAIIFSATTMEIAVIGPMLRKSYLKKKALREKYIQEIKNQELA